MQQENGNVDLRPSRSRSRSRSRPRLRSSSRLVSSDTVPEFIALKSPLYIFTEQHVTGVSSRRVVQFVTKILITSEKHSLDDHEKHYEGMVEASLVGTSRSSSSLQEEGGRDEEFQCRVYYSQKAVYIYTVQNVKKSPGNRNSVVGEEKVYSEVSKTRITGEKGETVTGWLSVGCKESISINRQKYTRDEHFTIGFRGSEVQSQVLVSSNKSTFDPTGTTVFEEKISFDEKNIGFVVSHSASAEMSDVWKQEMGSFGEEVSKYREVKFDVSKLFDEQIKKKKKRSLVTAPPPNSESSCTPSLITSSQTQSADELTTPASSFEKRSTASFSSTSADSRTTSVPATSTSNLSSESIQPSLASPMRTAESTNRSLVSQMTPAPTETDTSSLSMTPAADDGLPAPMLLKKARSRSKRHKLLKKSSELKVVNPEQLMDALTALRTEKNARMDPNTLKKSEKTHRHLRKSSDPPSKLIAPNSVYLYNTGANQSVHLTPQHPPNTATTAHSQEAQKRSMRALTLKTAGTTHEWIKTNPIRVSPAESSGMTVFEEDMHLEMLINKKRFVIDLKCPIVSEKRPEVEVLGFSFYGQKVSLKD